MGRACPLCPGISDVNLFRYCQGIVYLNAKISDRAFDLGVPKQKLDGPEIARTSVDQGSFCTSQRMRSEQPWVQPNAANPLGNQAGILARSHAAFGTTTTCKQEVAGPLVRKFQVIIDRLAGLFAQFKSDWPSCLLLSDRCAVRRVSAGSDIFDLIATTSQPRSLLSIAKLNIARSRARPSIWSFVRIDQTCLGRSGGFAPVTLPLFQGTRFWAVGVSFDWSCMVMLLSC
jgi:hypothetical protein